MSIVSYALKGNLKRFDDNLSKIAKNEHRSKIGLWFNFLNCFRMIGCGYEHCHYNNNPSWVWYTSYYTKEKGEYNTDVYVIWSSGYNGVKSVVYGDMSAKDENYGVRPLIMISETDLNNLFIE